jgi:hypothetical protein
MTTSKRIESHAAISWPYWLVGIAFLPIGIGVFILYLGWKKWKQSYLEIFNSYLMVNGKANSKIQLTEILNVTENESTLESYFHVSTLAIELKGNRIVEISYLKQASLILQTINEVLRVIEVEKNRQITPRKTEYDDLAVGGLERYNDLVGLWQAGLISDEDFEKEQSKFKL